MTSSASTLNIPTANQFRDAFSKERNNESLIISFVLLFTYVQSIKAQDTPFSGTFDPNSITSITVENGIITGVS